MTLTIEVTCKTSNTVKQLSQKLNISRTGVENRMAEITGFRKKYTHKNSGRLIISDAGSKLISQLHGTKSGVTKKSVTHHYINSNDKSTELLKKLLKSERDHNTQLQKQLDTVNSSNKHLGKLLDQQQQLQLTSQNENRQLRGQIKHLKTISGPVDKTTSKSQNNAKKSKSTFWQKLFGKH